MPRLEACLLALVLSRPVLASEAGIRAYEPDTAAMTVEDLARQLVEAESSDQLFAARTLRSLVRQSARIADRSADDMLTMEARQELADFDRVLSPACLLELDNPRLRGPCADILGLLQHEPATQPIRMALQEEERRRVRRKLQRALRRIAGDRIEGEG